MGLSTADHLAALRWYLPELRVDAVLAERFEAEYRSPSSVRQALAE